MKQLFLVTLGLIIVQIPLAQIQTITGTVLDDQANPVTGASIYLNNQPTEVQSDFNGSYSISANTQDTMSFNYVGLKTQNIIVEESNTIDIVMESEDSLDQVANEPSINKDNSPLIILNGLPYTGELSELNLDRVEYLKTLDSDTAQKIYGNTASNGAIIIENHLHDYNNVNQTIDSAINLIEKLEQQYVLNQHIMQTIELVKMIQFNNPTKNGIDQVIKRMDSIVLDEKDGYEYELLKEIKSMLKAPYDKTYKSYDYDIIYKTLKSYNNAFKIWVTDTALAVENTFDSNASQTNDTDEKVLLKESYINFIKNQSFSWNSTPTSIIDSFNLGNDLQGKLTELQMAQILAEKGCLLARKGAEGLELIRENLRAKDKDGKYLNYSRAAMDFCDSTTTDLGKKVNNKYDQVSQDSVALPRLNEKLLKACFPQKFHPVFVEKIAPRFKPEDLIPLGAIMAKVFASELNCTERGVRHTEGNIFLTVFKKRLFKLADFIINEMEKHLGTENSLTVEDIVGKKDREYLKRSFCQELKQGNTKEKTQIEFYLEKFYGSKKCN